MPNAHLWSVDSPRLYDLKISLNDDAVTERFGFRWFEIKDVKGDRQFFLNGKRIVLRTAISWGFWPYNGITPSDELAKRQITIAKELGLNMLNFHRNIGKPTFWTMLMNWDYSILKNPEVISTPSKTSMTTTSKVISILPTATRNWHAW